MDQQELDDAYDNDVYAFNAKNVLERQRINNEVAMAIVGKPMRVPQSSDVGGAHWHFAFVPISGSGVKSAAGPPRTPVTSSECEPSDAIQLAKMDPLSPAHRPHRDCRPRPAIVRRPDHLTGSVMAPPL
jgi:hypothetical protein